MSSTSNSIREKFPASKFAPFTTFLSVQKLSLLHYLGYRRFPLEEERIKWHDAAAAVCERWIVLTARH